MKLSLELLSYDPNYNYESDDEDEGMDTDELEQDELYGFSVTAVVEIFMPYCSHIHGTRAQTNTRLFGEYSFIRL